MDTTRTFRALGRTLGVGLVAALLSSAAAMAQQGGPAERPPASYTGDQYTDSRGCIFVRAGIGGNTSWVPRVGRDRQQLCGFTPSLGAAPQTAVAPAPTERDSDVVVIGAASETAAAPAQPAPQTVRATRPAAPSAAETRAAAAPAPVRTVRAPAPAVAPVVAAPAPAPVTEARAVPCSNLPRGIRIFFTGPDPRCGPQAVHPGDAARGIERPGPVVISPQGPVTVTVPEGYRLAWSDDRLNPNRGPRTAVGDAQMAQVWTDEVPRRLVLPVGQRLAVAPDSRTMTVSTRTAPAQSRPQAAAPAPAPEPITVSASHRNVLAGTYASRAAADAAYARLAGTGLPARLGMIERASGTVYAVVAGPFADSQAVVNGLVAARAAGFSEAVTRR